MRRLRALFEELEWFFFGGVVYVGVQICFAGEGFYTDGARFYSLILLVSLDVSCIQPTSDRMTRHSRQIVPCYQIVEIFCLTLTWTGFSFLSG